MPPRRGPAGRLAARPMSRTPGSAVRPHVRSGREDHRPRGRGTTAFARHLRVPTSAGALPQADDVTPSSELCRAPGTTAKRSSLYSSPGSGRRRHLIVLPRPPQRANRRPAADRSDESHTQGHVSPVIHQRVSTVVVISSDATGITSCAYGDGLRTSTRSPTGRPTRRPNVGTTSSPAGSPRFRRPLPFRSGNRDGLCTRTSRAIWSAVSRHRTVRHPGTPDGSATPVRFAPHEWSQLSPRGCEPDLIDIPPPSRPFVA